MPDLLPCPFCGTAERDDDQELGLERWLQLTPGSGMFRVECFGCGVESRMFTTPLEAVEAWNRRTGAVPVPLANTYIIPHRGDPCILCRKPMEEVEPGGCPVTVRELYSRIGQVEDEANAAWERSGDDTCDPALLVDARRLEEEAKRLRLLHLVLTRDFAPAGPS